MTSNVSSFGSAFSTSLLRVLGVSGTSSILVEPFVDLRTSCTSLGNVDLRGVKALATFLADLRMFSRILQDRFFAKYQSTDVVTPKTAAKTTTMIIAIIPPLDSVIPPEEGPAAPALLSPAPAEEPASPAAGPFPGCSGALVANAEKKEETELADICGVKETNVVVAAAEAEERGS